MAPSRSTTTPAGAAESKLSKPGKVMARDFHAAERPASTIEGAGALAIVSFWFMQQLISLGASRPLQVGDVPQLPGPDRSLALRTRREQAEQQQANAKDDRLAFLRVAFATSRRDRWPWSWESIRSARRNDPQCPTGVDPHCPRRI